MIGILTNFNSIVLILAIGIIHRRDDVGGGRTGQGESGKVRTRALRCEMTCVVNAMCHLSIIQIDKGDPAPKFGEAHYLPLLLTSKPRLLLPSRRFRVFKETNFIRNSPAMGVVGFVVQGLTLTLTLEA